MGNYHLRNEEEFNRKLSYFYLVIKKENIVLKVDFMHLQLKGIIELVAKPSHITLKY